MVSPLYPPPVVPAIIDGGGEGDPLSLHSPLIQRRRIGGVRCGDDPTQTRQLLEQDRETLPLQLRPEALSVVLAGARVLLALRQTPAPISVATEGLD